MRIRADYRTEKEKNSIIHSLSNTFRIKKIKTQENGINKRLYIELD